MSTTKTNGLPTDFKIVPLNAALEPLASKLEDALDEKSLVLADQKREDFYEIISDSGWFLVHRYGTATLFLVAHFPFRPPLDGIGEPAPALDDLTAFEEDIV